MAKCRPIKTEKYRKRPSPPFHAGDCKRLTKKGNDGKSYTSTADVKGIYKWVAAGRTTQKKPRGTYYEIHDNRGRPFVVLVNERQKFLVVYKAIITDPEAREWKVIPGDQIYETHFQKVFIGDNILRDKLFPAFGSKFSKGNSILAHIKGDTYLHVGTEVFTFQTPDGDVIEEYHSPIGNNDVPYPMAVGQKYVYMMLDHDHHYVPREYFNVKKDLSSQYYGWTVEKLTAEKIKASKKNYKLKMIHARQI